MKKSYKRGFTLIELLVVIAIIGILASIVLASLNSARQKGRDARRVADLKEIQLALELSYDATGVYPPALTTAALVTPGYISVIPTDPSNGNSYAYAPWAASGSPAVCSSYHLGASLEVSNNSALSSAVHETTLTPGTGETNPPGKVECTASRASPDFHGSASGKCQTTDAGVACYDVTM